MGDGMSHWRWYDDVVGTVVCRRRFDYNGDVTAGATTTTFLGVATLARSSQHRIQGHDDDDDDDDDGDDGDDTSVQGNSIGLVL